MTDPINHPEHYTSGGFETWDFIQDMDLSYEEGNAVKYLTRAGKKTPDPTQDIDKAIAYCKRLVRNQVGNDHFLARYFEAHKLDAPIRHAITCIVGRRPLQAIQILLEAQAERQAAAERPSDPEPEPGGVVEG